VLTLLLTALIAAQPTPIMTADQVKPGMKGVGKSVFFGSRVEEFGVEVIDVMPQAWPRGDMILCRLSGHGLEEAGVVAGMSGSPVYIEGKLVGAVAYGWGFSKEPIAGITPIAQMLEIWKEKDRLGAAGGSGHFAPGEAAEGFKPLPLAVAVSGLTSALAERIGPALQPFGLVPVAASGRAAVPEPDTSLLVPGAAVGVALVDGDIRLSAIGTLTAREGDRILAFGHPMFQAGNVRMPMVGGRIHTVMPSVAGSFKLFSVSSPLGTFTQDRLFGVGGTIGPSPRMLPATAVIASPSGTDTYRFRVLDNEDLAPVLTSTALIDAIYQTEGTMEEMTLSTKMTVVLLDSSPANRQSPFASRRSVVVEHRYADTDPATNLLKAVRNELDVLFRNRFLAVRVESIALQLEFKPGRELTWLTTAAADRRTVKPGQVVNVRLGLRDFRGDQSERTVAVRIPASVRAGNLRLVIGQHDSLMMFENMRAPGLLEPRSFQALLDLFSRTGRENELVVAGYSSVPGVTIGDKELVALPPSLKSVLVNPRAESPLQLTGEGLVLEQTVLFDRVVSGVARVELEVKP
jgi:hypothetical protein